MTKKKETAAETETGTEVAISEKASAVAGNNPAFDMSKFTVKEVVTLPLLKPTVDRPFGVQINSDFYLGKEIEDSRYKNYGRPTMLRVIDLSDGIEKEMMVQSVLKSTLTEYCGEGDESVAGLVGRYFALSKERKQVSVKEDGTEEAQRYHKWSVAELELAE